MKNTKKLTHGSDNAKKKWEPMELKFIDRIKDIILGGGGKLSTTGGDPGENRKEMGGPS